MGAATKEKASLAFAHYQALRSMLEKPLMTRQHRLFNRHGVVVKDSVANDLCHGGYAVFNAGGTQLRLTAPGRYFAESLPRICGKCGCHDAKACEGGCSWAGADLCSACVAVSS